MADQNLAVAALLADMGNGEVQDPAADLPLVNGSDDPISVVGRILQWGAEWHWDPTYSQYPHHALGGHLVFLGLSQAKQIWEEYTSPLFNWAHQQGAIAGFAHLEFLNNAIPQQLNCCAPLEYPVEVALGSSDFISEDVISAGTSVAGLSADAPVQAYYRLLNCGFRPGFAAGTDYPCRNGSTPGALLTYVKVPSELTYRKWIDGIASGRTVVSRNGHNEFLELTVNQISTPGDEVRLTGEGAVQVSIKWSSQISLSGTIELVQNGIVVASSEASVSPSAPVTVNYSLSFIKSGWIAARRMGKDGHYLHTGAVFVLVDGAPIRTSADDAQFYIQWMDNLLQKTAPGGEWNWLFENSLNQAQLRYQSAKVVYQNILSDALSIPSAGEGILTAQVPTAFENDASYELGTMFWADVGGLITNIRIYTDAREGGEHTVRIWRAADKTLVAGPYRWDLSSGIIGWRTFTMPVPAEVSPNVDYIVAVSNSGDRYYPGEGGGFDMPVINGHLHTYVGSGVYSETLGEMPDSVWSNTNYFRDVIFRP